MANLYDDVRFWAQIVGDCKRTIMCSPELESRIKTQIDARGLGGVISVVATRNYPDENSVIVIDEGALAAVASKTLTQALRSPFAG